MTQVHGELIPTFAGTGVVSQIVIAPDGDWLLLGRQYSAAARLLARDGRHRRDIGAKGQPIHRMTIASGGDLIVGTSNGYRVQIWATDGRMLRSVRGFGYALAPDGSWLVTERPTACSARLRRDRAVVGAGAPLQVTARVQFHPAGA